MFLTEAAFRSSSSVRPTRTPARCVSGLGAWARQHAMQAGAWSRASDPVVEFEARSGAQGGTHGETKQGAAPGGGGGGGGDHDGATLRENPSTRAVISSGVSTGRGRLTAVSAEAITRAQRLFT